MAKRDDGRSAQAEDPALEPAGAEAPHAHRALLAAVLAVVVAVSAGIFVGASGSGDQGQAPVSAPRPSRGAVAPAAAGSWVSTWAAAPTGPEPGTEPVGLANSSVRNVVHTSVGGTGARITLSNLYGQTPLTVTSATLALSASPGGASAVPGTMRGLTFDGRRSVVIPAGDQAVSDAVRMRVPTASDLLVSTYTPAAAGPVTYHVHARQVSYQAAGDMTADPGGAAYGRRVVSWRYLTAVDVLTSEAVGTVVAFGDSLTDGITSSTGANHRWTDGFAQRLDGGAAAQRFAVVNEGISGNRLLTDGGGRPAANPSGLSRFQRDALARTGVKTVVVELGVNDVLHDPRRPSAAAIVAALRTLTREAHAHGVRVVGATLTPFGGHRGADPAAEAVRAQVNAAIRGGGVFDAVADFDRALRDPAAPSRLRPAFDSGDHLHPNDSGYAAMANALDPRTLRGTGAAAAL
ncbi:SGNH/GDSL hydrolase family protein [Streptomyces sp. NPDC050560]|uniref:SGNH/GDSL hydrolase family protein n=1 Tax=Streptomyces sp. NPDC050560 TaxID=3365630 RepID=UPI00378CB612